MCNSDGYDNGFGKFGFNFSSASSGVIGATKALRNMDHSLGLKEARDIAVAIGEGYNLAHSSANEQDTINRLKNHNDALAQSSDILRRKLHMALQLLTREQLLQIIESE